MRVWGGVGWGRGGEGREWWEESVRDGEGSVRECGGQGGGGGMRRGVVGV